MRDKNTFMKAFQNKSYYSYFEQELDDTFSFNVNLSKTKFSIGFNINCFNYNISYPLALSLIFSYPSYSSGSVYGPGIKTSYDISYDYDDKDDSFIFTWNDESKSYFDFSFKDDNTEESFYLNSLNKMSFIYYDDLDLSTKCRLVMEDYSYVFDYSLKKLMYLSYKNKECVEFNEFGPCKNLFNDRIVYNKSVDGSLISYSYINKDDVNLLKGSIHYDSLKRITKIIKTVDDIRSETELKYDSSGRVILAKNKKKNSFFKFVYDESGLLIKFIISNDEEFKEVLEYSFIYEDSYTILIDPLKQKTYYCFDEEGKTISTFNKFGSGTYMEYSQINRDYYPSVVASTSNLVSSKISNFSFINNLEGYQTKDVVVVRDEKLPELYMIDKVAYLFSGSEFRYRHIEKFYLGQCYTFAFFVRGKGKVIINQGTQRVESSFISSVDYRLIVISLAINEFSSFMDISFETDDELYITGLNLRKSTLNKNTKIDTESMESTMGSISSSEKYDQFFRPTYGVGTGLGENYSKYTNLGINVTINGNTTDYLYSHEYPFRLIKETTDISVGYFENTNTSLTSFPYIVNYDYDYFSEPIRIEKQDEYPIAFEYDKYCRVLKQNYLNEDEVYSIVSYKYETIGNVDILKTGVNYCDYYSVDIENDINNDLVKSIIIKDERLNYDYDLWNRIIKTFSDDFVFEEFEYDNIALDQVKNSFSGLSDLNLSYKYDSFNRLIEIDKNYNSDTSVCFRKLEYNDVRQSVTYQDNSNLYKFVYWMDDDENIRSCAFYESGKQYFLIASTDEMSNTCIRTSYSDFTYTVDKYPVVSEVFYESIDRLNLSQILNLSQTKILGDDVNILFPLNYTEQVKDVLDLYFLNIGTGEHIKGIFRGDINGKEFEGVLCAEILDTSYINIKYRDGLINKDTFTISSWFYVDSGEEEFKSGELFRAENENIVYKVWASREKIRLDISDFYGEESYFEEITYSSLGWHFFMLSVDKVNGRIRFFFDGKYYDYRISIASLVAKEAIERFGGKGKVYLGGLMYSDKSYDEALMYEYYRLMCDYFINKTYNFHSYYKPSITELCLNGKVDNNDVYPLHSDFKSALGKKEPTLVTNMYSRISRYDPNPLFRYNGLVGRYMLFLNGNRVEYEVNTNKATIMLALTFIEDMRSRRYLFGLKDDGKEVLSLVLKKINNSKRGYSLFLECNGKSYEVKSSIDEFYYLRLVLSYEKVDGMTYKVMFAEMSSNSLINIYNNEFVLSSSAFNLVIGASGIGDYAYAFIENLVIMPKYITNFTKGNDLISYSKENLYSSEGLLREELFFLNSSISAYSRYCYYNTAKGRTQALPTKQMISFEGVNSNEEYQYRYNRFNQVTYISKKYFQNVAGQEFGYDKIGRISSYHDNRTNKKRYSYTYDIYNNISCNGYQKYEDKNHHLLLTSYKDIPIVYDSKKLYPISFGSVEYMWKEGKLVESRKGVSIIKYEYGIDDSRTAKIVDGQKTKYIYSGSRLIQTLSSDMTRIIYYDETGRAYMLRIRRKGKTDRLFYYIYNAIGEIIHLVEDDKSNYIDYEYDAFGVVEKCEYDKSVIEEDRLGEAIGVSPIIYKGYVYDKELQLYWVSSRFYSPEWCRWISPDSVEYIDIQNNNGLNLYAYCGNDPINKYDPSGKFAITLATLLVGGLIAGGIGAGIGLGIAIYKDVKEDGIWFNGDWTDYVGRILGGFVVGFGLGICTALGAGVGVAALRDITVTLFTSTGLTLSLGSAIGIGSAMAFVTGMAGYAIRTGISQTEDFKVQNMFIEGGFNAFSGMLSILGGFLGGIAGVHNTICKEFVLQKGDFWLRLLVENVFTVGFKLISALIKPYFMI